MRHIFLTLAALAFLAGCSQPKGEQKDANEAPTPPGYNTDYRNAIYYWKSNWVPEDDQKWELDFLKRHDVGRVYVRFFDVVDDPEHLVVPSAEISPRKHYIGTANVEIVPTVFITTEAIDAMKKHENEVAFKIHSYIQGMCMDLQVDSLREIQLDCDWTASTREGFFQLCTELSERLHKYGIRLTSTIRLHQLTQPAPPVDGGVLMVYNVGSVKDPSTENSIIDASIVRTYLEKAPEYPLHLDVAYPVFAWEVVFVDGKFKKLRHIRNSEPEYGEPEYGEEKWQGEVYVREEYSNFSEVKKTKAVVEKYLNGKPHHNILYHLDKEQLSRYYTQEINSIYE